MHESTGLERSSTPLARGLWARLGWMARAGSRRVACPIRMLVLRLVIEQCGHVHVDAVPFTRIDDDEQGFVRR